MTKSEELYLKAKDAYYNEQPIMSDAEFDELERKLREEGSEVVGIVGSWDRKAKIKHPSPMRSLEKIQADKTTGAPPTEEFKKWMFNAISKCGDYSAKIEVGQKLDGNAVNLVYLGGVIKYALSRGDGEYGRDYLPKIDPSQYPKMIPSTYGYTEVRCEAVIRKDTFAEFYADKFSNERNYVAGVLNSDDATEKQIYEIDLVPVEMRTIYNGKIEYHDITEIANWGFKNYDKLNRLETTVAITNNGFDEFFTELFEKYEKFKYEESPYRVDGMVVKLMANNRHYLGEVEHHPLWAIAIKFKPEDCVTEVVGFEMNMGKTGTFTPVALLKPVDLDGSVVSKASAYNYSFIEDNSLNVGSIVSLVKSGDIIPQIVNVVAPSDKPFDVLGNFKCPYCGSELIIENGKHIKCPKENCNGKRLQRFINSMSALKLYGLGESMMETLFTYVYDRPYEYLTHSRTDIKFEMMDNGVIGKVWDNFLDELFNLKELTIEQVIALNSYEGISNDGKTIKEIGKKLSGCNYNFSGLEKAVVSGWEPGEEKYENVMWLVRSIEEHGRKVMFHEEQSSKLLKLTLTGSPKVFGYKTKAEYVAYLNTLGYSVEEVSIKECDYLITDDMDSNSSKMQNAKKLGKIIKTYGESI